MPVGELDPPLQTRDDIQRVIDGERPVDMMLAPNIVIWKDVDRCWATKEVVYMGFVCRIGCDEVGDRTLGLCSDHALEILGYAEPDRLDHPGRNGVRGLEAAGIRFRRDRPRIIVPSAPPAPASTGPSAGDPE